MGRTFLISSLFFLEPYSLNLCKTCQKTHVTKLEDSLYFLNKVNYLKLLHMKLFISCLVEFYPAELHVMSFNKIYSFLNFFLLLEERVAKKQQQKARNPCQICDVWCVLVKDWREFLIHIHD